MSFLAAWYGNRGYTAQARGKHEKAVAYYEKAISLGYNVPAKLIAYSVMLLRAGEYKRSQEILQLADASPSAKAQHKMQIRLNYAIVKHKLGDDDAAIEILKDLLNRQKTGLIYNTLGTMLVLAQRYDEALEINREALEYDPDDPVTLDNIGQTYFRMGIYDKSREYLGRALEQKPGQIESLYYMARLDIMDEDLEAAKQRAERINPARISPMNSITPAMVEDLKKQAGCYDEDEYDDAGGQSGEEDKAD